MKYRGRFELSAKEDLLAAFHWYKARQAGLGGQFLRSVATVEESLSRNPDRQRVQNEPYRSANLRKFPYALHYRIIDDTVSVLARLHFRQSPERWPGG